MQKKYTKEERAAYMASLREQWKANKAQADQDQDAKAKWLAVQTEAPGQKFSYYGFFYALQSMKQNNFDGLPYVDAKTFQGWKSSGFIVKKGETSKIHGLTWVNASNNDDNEPEERRLYPKAYALFHRTQVQAI